MDYREIHIAVRALVHSAGLSTFVISVQAVEDHPGRVDVLWSVHVPRDPPIHAHFFKTREPLRLLDYLRTVLELKGESVPPQVAEIGDVPSSSTP